MHQNIAEVAKCWRNAPKHCRGSKMLKKCTKKQQRWQDAENKMYPKVAEAAKWKEKKRMHKEAAEVAKCWRNASRASRIVSSAFLLRRFSTDQIERWLKKSFLFSFLVILAGSPTRHNSSLNKSLLWLFWYSLYYDVSWSDQTVIMYCLIQISIFPPSLLCFDFVSQCWLSVLY